MFNIHPIKGDYQVNNQALIYEKSQDFFLIKYLCLFNLTLHQRIIKSLHNRHLLNDQWRFFFFLKFILLILIISIIILKAIIIEIN